MVKNYLNDKLKYFPVTVVPMGAQAVTVPKLSNPQHTQKQKPITIFKKFTHNKKHSSGVNRCASRCHAIQKNKTQSTNNNQTPNFK